MAHTVVFKDSSVILPSQEQLEGCPVHHVPLAVHVPMNPEEILLLTTLHTIRVKAFMNCAAPVELAIPP